MWASNTRKMLLGVLLGVFLSVSAFETIHLGIEVEDYRNFCSFVYDSLTKHYDARILYSVKLVYKIFAWPVKTIYCLIEDSRVEIQRENGQWIKLKVE